MPPKTFGDYQAEAANWITLASGEYYPDILPLAVNLYQPVLVLFGQLLASSESPERLLRQIVAVPNGWMRVQLSRVFRKYVSPATPVEMLKVKARLDSIVRDFAKDFRPIHQVQAAFNTRPMPDETLCALLWEYKTRGQKGYDLTERFFDLAQALWPTLTVTGPKRAGSDILMRDVFADYPAPRRPVDFVVYEGATVLAVGLARYDSDRGGAQEDDRVGQYHTAASELLRYARHKRLAFKVVLLNDGPGLLLGSMWRDYAALEKKFAGRLRVSTLRMMPERLTLSWLKDG